MLSGATYAANFRLARDEQKDGDRRATDDIAGPANGTWGESETARPAQRAARPGRTFIDGDRPLSGGKEKSRLSLFLAWEGHSVPRNYPEISCNIPLSHPDAGLQR